MRVFRTNTSAGIYLASRPFCLYEFLTTPSKEECVQTVRSFSYAW